MSQIGPAKDRTKWKTKEKIRQATIDRQDKMKASNEMKWDGEERRGVKEVDRRGIRRAFRWQINLSYP